MLEPVQNHGVVSYASQHRLGVGYGNAVGEFVQLQRVVTRAEVNAAVHQRRAEGQRISAGTANQRGNILHGASICGVGEG